MLKNRLSMVTPTKAYKAGAHHVKEEIYRFLNAHRTSCAYFLQKPYIEMDILRGRTRNRLMFQRFGYLVYRNIVDNVFVSFL